jgi:hypothetical protein
MLPPSHNHDDDLNYGSHSSEDFHPVQMESDSMVMHIWLDDNLEALIVFFIEWYFH